MTHYSPSAVPGGDRDQALQVLTQARDLLAARLTERILEQRDELLDDARGDSYAGEIESLFEQFGSKLNQLNTLLTSLPAKVDLPQPAPVFAAPNVTQSSSFMVQVQPGPFETDTVETAPPPQEVAPLDAATAAPLETSLGFQVFVRQILRRDLESAGATLGLLLDIPLTRGITCAARFRDQLDIDAGFLTRAKTLRESLRSGTPNDVLLLLWECFGLQGIESLEVMEKLRTRL